MLTSNGIKSSLENLKFKIDSRSITECGKFRKLSERRPTLISLEILAKNPLLDPELSHLKGEVKMERKK
jgi:hypothetical protein